MTLRRGRLVSDAGEVICEPGTTLGGITHPNKGLAEFITPTGPGWVAVTTKCVQILGKQWAIGMYFFNGDLKEVRATLHKQNTEIGNEYRLHSSCEQFYDKVIDEWLEGSVSRRFDWGSVRTFVDGHSNHGGIIISFA